FAPGAGAYFPGSAAFSILTASKVSAPVPCSTLSDEWSYIDSKASAAGEDFGFLSPTEKSLMLFIATAGCAPLRIRGREGPRAIARNGEFCGVAGRLRRERLSHPSSVAITPGVPLSLKSCA